MFKNLKITDFRIPLTLLLLTLVSTTIAILIDNNLSYFFGILGFGSAIGLMLVYFPLLTIKIARNKIENKHKVVNAIGIFCISFVLIGVIFRLFQLPGAGPIIIVGCSCFSINFLPAWFFSVIKDCNWPNKILRFLFCTCLAFLIIAYEFRVMRWPGGNMMLNLSYYSFLFVLLPYCIFLLLFKRDYTFLSFPNFFLFGFIIAFIVSGILTNKLTNRAIISDNKTYNSIEKNIKIYATKNKFIYDALDKNISKDSSQQNIKLKIELLKKQSDELSNYIQNLKTHLVMIVDGLPESFRDSITFDKINAKDHYDIVTFTLIGNNSENPKTGKYSALELKSKIESYIEELNKLVPEEYAVQLKESNSFDFSDIEIEDGYKETWINMNFYHEPLANVYTTLTSFQANVRYLEMTVLNELFNKASSANKENIAGQLAELAIKYETEKQAKKIAMLQKDQEMNDLKIQAKDAEISERESTITLFTFGGIMVGILLIFVIRSNVLRKQANKELAQQKDIITIQKNEVENQKHIVEEKQKEILDSINYAKRLQEAILPPLDYINEHLPHNFVLYQPKDVVAGDFYWAEMKDDKFFIAAADCTGHGVPGAMVSVVCSNALNRTVNEFGITNTGNILDKTRELVLETFAKGNAEVKDGMDISLLCIDKKNNKAFWSGANNPLWYVDPVTSGTQPSVTSSVVEKSTASGLDSARPDNKTFISIENNINLSETPSVTSSTQPSVTSSEVEKSTASGLDFYGFTKQK